MSDYADKLGAISVKNNGQAISSVSNVPAFSKDNISFSVASNVGEYIAFSNVVRIWCGYYGLEINVGSLESKGRKFFIESDNTVTTYNWQRLDGFGATTAADLASILGAMYPRLVSATDNLNNVTTPGFYICNGDAANLPTAATYLLRVYHYDNYVLQCATTRDAAKSFYRTRDSSSSWSSWVRVYDSGILSDTTTLSSLASALGVGTMEYNTALADCNAPQKYVQYVTVNTANIPDSLVDSGYLINISPLPESSPDYGFYSFQLLYAYTNGDYYIRCSRRVSGGISWTAWKQL